MACPRTTRRTGFTLIEILIVIAVLGMLTALTIGVARQAIIRANEQETLIVLKAMSVKIKDINTLPTAAADGNQANIVHAIRHLDNANMAAMVGDKHWKNDKVVDAWQREVYYFCDNAKYEPIVNRFKEKNNTPIFLSAGSDGQVNTADDLMNP